LTTCISYHKKFDLSSTIFKKIQLFCDYFFLWVI
jgi:hypothetical protein